MKKEVVHHPEFSYPPKQKIGLGTAVALVAKPIASVLDSSLGTKLANCPACKNREDKMNKAIPDILHPFRG